MIHKVDDMWLSDHISKAAMLEQTAEECTELAKACLKLARYERGENPVYGKTKAELVEDIHEEYADVHICVDELYHGNVMNYMRARYWIDIKARRLVDRLERRINESRLENHTT